MGVVEKANSLYDDSSRVNGVLSVGMEGWKWNRDSWKKK